ncbi:hypothetical protein [Paenibacillus sp. DYY-L-2]|uniref:hypothetical protein n=1 Tax=Paenibacillus sp. DYY-L-2 TaxID=3447013 RepID=UPI003F4FB07A
MSGKRPLVPREAVIEAVPGGLRVTVPAKAAEESKRRRRTSGGEPGDAAGKGRDAGSVAPRDSAPECTVVLPAYAPGAPEREALPERLAARPLLLAGLLEEGAGAILALLPEQPPWRRQAATDPACTCGARECGHGADAMARGDAAWAADAGLRLALLGWTPETLAAAALDRWAAVKPLPDPEEALRRAAGGPEHAPGSAGANGGPALAEWLADMAGQGRLHQPGPEYHDVAEDLLKALRHNVKPGHGPAPAPLTAMLPGVSGAAKGLALVAGRVMERAAETAGAPTKKPR